MTTKHFNEDEWVPYPEVNLILDHFFPIEEELINLTGKGNKYDYIWSLYHGLEWEANISLLDLGRVNAKLWTW